MLVWNDRFLLEIWFLKPLGDCAARATSHNCSKVWSIVLAAQDLCDRHNRRRFYTIISCERVSCRGVIIRSGFEQISGLIGRQSGHGSFDASCVGCGVVDIFRH